jgi:pimeloyl-ACP methyl ester carboxylesterase
VFLVHGLWPDSDAWWMPGVEEALQRRGIEAIAVPYRAFVLEYLLGFGTDRPADRIAAFVAQLEERHARTTCPAPLRFRAIGYSAGTVVLSKAAERGVAFDRVYFAGSPLPFWTQPPERLGSVINYYSLLDGLVWVSLGSGQFGLSAAQENRLCWRWHLIPLWLDRDEVERVADELEQGAAGPPHTCFDEAEFRAWYLEARERLCRGE